MDKIFICFSEMPRACRINGIHRHKYKEKCTISVQLAFHRLLKSKSHCLENSTTHSGRSIINSSHQLKK